VTVDRYGGLSIGAHGPAEFPRDLRDLVRVEAVDAFASRWYQRLLGCVGGHGGTEYERLWDPNLHTSKWGSDGLILQLHAWEIEHHHGPMGDPSRAVGNGMLLWFEVDDFDAAVARARELDAPILLDVHRNPNANHRELWIRDPDGYTVVLASPDGDAKEA
jgi:catechol 2,3-dioxygenase-like lactoylglutathione lyase family enzyme